MSTCIYKTQEIYKNCSMYVNIYYINNYLYFNVYVGFKIFILRMFIHSIYSHLKISSIIRFIFLISMLYNFT